jgi:hypothetical protein
LTVMANATNKKTVMEDDNAGTEAVTGAMRIPSEPKQTGTTPEVDQHHHRWDAIHLRKQRWRWERPFYHDDRPEQKGDGVWQREKVSDSHLDR